MKTTRVAITACSDARPPEKRRELEAVLEVFREMGLEPVCSEHIFQNGRLSAPPAGRKPRNWRRFTGMKPYRGFLTFPAKSVQ